MASERGMFRLSNGPQTQSSCLVVLVSKTVYRYASVVMAISKRHVADSTQSVSIKRVAASGGVLAEMSSLPGRR